MSFKIVWKANEVTAIIKNAANEIIEQGADMILEDARRNLMRGAQHPTGELASEIEIKKSKFQDGGYIVQAQGAGKYHRYRASFVEMGTHKMRAIPYLRPALRKNRAKIRKMLKDRVG